MTVTTLSDEPKAIETLSLACCVASLNINTAREQRKCKIKADQSKQPAVSQAATTPLGQPKMNLKTILCLAFFFVAWNNTSAHISTWKGPGVELMLTCKADACWGACSYVNHTGQNCFPQDALKLNSTNSHTQIPKFCMFAWRHPSCQIVYETQSTHTIHTLHTISTQLSLQPGNPRPDARGVCAAALCAGRRASWMLNELAGWLGSWQNVWFRTPPPT